MLLPKASACSRLIPRTLVFTWLSWTRISSRAMRAKVTLSRLAVLYGHNTGYAHDRLLKTLKAFKQYHKAIQLCDLVLLDRFAFQAQGMGNKATFAKAREQFVKLLPKAADSESDILYDKDQISAILFRQQERLRLEQESKRVLDEAGKYIWTNEREYKRLMKQYHDLQSKLW